MLSEQARLRAVVDRRSSGDRIFRSKPRRTEEEVRVQVSSDQERGDRNDTSGECDLVSQQVQHVRDRRQRRIRQHLGRFQQEAPVSSAQVSDLDLIALLLQRRPVFGDRILVPLRKLRSQRDTGRLDLHS